MISLIASVCPRASAFTHWRDGRLREFANFLLSTANNELLRSLKGDIKIKLRGDAFAQQAKYQFALRDLFDQFMSARPRNNDLQTVYWFTLRNGPRWHSARYKFAAGIPPVCLRKLKI